MFIFDDLFSFGDGLPTIEPGSLWVEFKGALRSGIEQFVPHRTVSTKPSLPWITQELKRSTRKRDSLYDKYKRLRRPSDRHAFVEARPLVKHKLKQAHNRYIEDILGLTDTSEQSEPHCQSSSETNKSTYFPSQKFKTGFKRQCSTQEGW